MCGGGILPATIHNNVLYFLLGREHKYCDTPLKFSDFGGGQDDKESPKETAIREGTEELTGFLGNETDMRDRLKKGNMLPIQVNDYVVHIFPLEYDPKLVYYYNNNQAFLQKKLKPEFIKKSKFFEKAEIRWFSVDDMKKERKLLRSFFLKTLDYIVNNKSAIFNFISQRLSKKRKEKMNRKSYRTKLSLTKRRRSRRRRQTRKMRGG
jgi:hypothetical protein